jgi:hypothetical protein
MAKQTILEALLIMAYNVGRDHARTLAFTPEAGREATVKALTALFDDIDPGDLARPADSLFDREPQN